MPRHLARRQLPVRHGRPAAALDRHQHRRRRRRSRSPSPERGETLPYYRFAPGPFTNFARIISFQSTAESHYNGLTLELNRRFASRVRRASPIRSARSTTPCPTRPPSCPEARPTMRSSRRTRRTSTPIAPRQQRPAAPVRVQRHLRHQWPGAGRLRHERGARSRMDFERRSTRRRRTAVHGARRQRRLEQRRQHAKRLRAGDDTERVHDCRTTTSLDLRIARDIPVVGRVRVQPIFEVYNLLNADNINIVNQALYSVNVATNVLTPNTASASRSQPPDSGSCSSRLECGSRRPHGAP